MATSFLLAELGEELTSVRLRAEALGGRGLAGEGLGHGLLQGREGQGLGCPRPAGSRPLRTDLGEEQEGHSPYLLGVAPQLVHACP